VTTRPNDNVPTGDRAPVSASRHDAAGRPRSTTRPAWLRAAALWAAGAALVLIGSRPMWRVPLQADDFWLLLTIHDGQGDVVADSVGYARDWIATGTHVNPVGQFLDALLNGTMLTARGDVLTASARHHGTLAVLSVVTMVVAAHLLSRLVRLASGAHLSPATLSVPLGLGFLCTVQITTPWSGFDPLVALPVYGGLQTMLGLAYLAAATRALMRTDSRVSIAGASLLGVLGFLTYDGFVTYVATVVVIAWVFRRSWDSGTGRTRWALAWLVLPPLATLLVRRLVVATHDVGYAGTEWGPDPLITPAAWLTSLHTAWNHLFLNRLIFRRAPAAAGDAVGEPEPPLEPR